MLKSVYLGFRKVTVQRVTVVEFGLYNRSGDRAGCLEVLKINYTLCLKKSFDL